MSPSALPRARARHRESPTHGTLKQHSRGAYRRSAERDGVTGFNPAPAPSFPSLRRAARSSSNLNSTSPPSASSKPAVWDRTMDTNCRMRSHDHDHDIREATVGATWVHTGVMRRPLRSRTSPRNRSTASVACRRNAPDPPASHGAAMRCATNQTRRLTHTFHAEGLGSCPSGDAGGCVVVVAVPRQCAVG